MEIVTALHTATQSGLTKALERAAAGGQTSTVESLLGGVAARFPDAVPASAIQALNRAVHSHRWATASYLADFLATSSPTKSSQAGDRGGVGDVQVLREIVRCLRVDGGGEGAGAFSYPNNNNVISEAIVAKGSGMQPAGGEP
jgi:hypothetical protein